MGILRTLFELTRENNSTPKIEIVGETFDSGPKDDPYEHLKKKREGVLLRKQALEEAGVDLSIFTEKKAINDARSFLDRFAPFWKQIRVDQHHPSAFIDPCNLTGTGKVPKNVVTSQVIFDPPNPRSNDSVIAHISYLREGVVNKFDANLWYNRNCLSFSVRIIDDAYTITAASRYDMDRDFGKALYAGSGGNEQAKAIISSSFEELKKGR